MRKKDEVHNFVVYRGLTLTDSERQAFMIKEENTSITFTSFTSTSRNRILAESFGDTLLVIDLNVENTKKYKNVGCGADVSSLSDFPNEEEFLMWPEARFHFVKYEYDTEKEKHVIYLKTPDLY